MPEKTKQIMFRGSADYKAMLKIEAANRRVDVQSLIYRAVEAYTNGSIKAPTSDNSDGISEISENKVHSLTDGGTRSSENYDPRNALLHDYLEEILESGIDWFIDGIVANLKCWGEMSRFVRRVDEQPARDAEAFREDVNAIFRRRLGSVTEHPSPYQQGNREEGKSTAKRTKGRGRS